MPKTTKPAFRCRYLPRARRNITKVKNRTKIINNVYLVNNTFTTNTNFNQYNFCRWDYQSSKNKDIDKVLGKEDKPCSTMDASFLHSQEDNLNNPFIYNDEKKSNSIQQKSETESEISTNCNLVNQIQPPKLNSIFDKNYLSSNQDVTTVSINKPDGDKLLAKNKLQKCTIRNISRRFKRISLKEPINLQHRYTPRTTLISNTPSDTLSHFEKIVRFNVNGTIHKKFINTKPKLDADENKTLSPGTSTPLKFMSFNETSKQKNWELSPVRNTEHYPKMTETCDKMLQYGESEQNIDNSSDDIFNSIDNLDVHTIEQNNSSIETPNDTNYRKTDKLECIVPTVTEYENDNSSFLDLSCRTAYSVSFTEINSYPDLATKNDSKTKPPSLPSIKYTDRETNESDYIQNSIADSNSQSMQLHNELVTNETNSLFFSSDEHNENTELEIIDSSVESEYTKPKKYSDNSECYTNIIPGKKWRRSLFAAGNQKRMTINVANNAYQHSFNKTREHWNFRFSVNPQIFIDKSFDKNCSNKLIHERTASDEQSHQGSKLEYDSIIDDTFFDESECVKKDYNDEFDCTMKIHQQVSYMLQTDDLPEKLGLAEEKVLDLCYEKVPVDFNSYVANFKHCKKIGEGMFGEVYSYYKAKEQIMLKVIPIEGKKLVNLTAQKTYSEVFSEICIALSLSNLKNFVDDNYTDGFCGILKIACLKGAYPTKLINEWNQYDKTKGSDNDSPTMFDQNQLYVALEMLPGGEPLENYKFCSARQSYSVLLQVIYTLAVAEQAYEFEHRDLHWGNILISKTFEKQIEYKVDGEKYMVTSYGRKVTIIDYTLSRIRSGKFDIYNDLESDQEVFQAYGDYQFDIYRDMRKDVNGRWGLFKPITNVRWIHYLAAKCYHGVFYKTKHKIHKTYLYKIKTMRDNILKRTSATDIMKNLV